MYLTRCGDGQGMERGFVFKSRLKEVSELQQDNSMIFVLYAHACL